MAMARTEVVIALDSGRLDEAMRVIEATRDRVGFYKVGSILFTSAGPKAVEAVRSSGRQVFLDLKFHDIPNTVMGAVGAAAAMGVYMLTVHCAGGVEMMRAALEGAGRGPERPRIIGVTVLTSLAAGGDTFARVLSHARSAAEAGIDGIVCSPLEVNHVKRTYGEKLLAVVPGIRLGDQGTDDQARVGTPGQAVRDGADFIVVGRSVTGAQDPSRTLIKVLEDIDGARR